MVHIRRTHIRVDKVQQLLYLRIAKIIGIYPPIAHQQEIAVRTRVQAISIQAGNLIFLRIFPCIYIQFTQNIFIQRFVINTYDNRPVF